MPRSRWLSFKLRTLFVLIAAAALPCAWYARMHNWREQRYESTQRPGFHADPLHDAADAPWPLWLLFNELGVGHVYLEEATPEDLQRAQSIFPEARIIVLTKNADGEWRRPPFEDN
jgi:hypothetical protein